LKRVNPDRADETEKSQKEGFLLSPPKEKLIFQFADDLLRMGASTSIIHTAPMSILLRLRNIEEGGLGL
jgi:hypothetical protein